MIIDTHTHVYPDAIAARAIGASIPDMVLFGDGTVTGLRSAQDAAGVSLSCCLAIASTAARVDAANAYVGRLDRDRFIPVGTVHPELSPAENLASLRAHGVRGVKLHPVIQRYQLDDPRILAILEALAGEYPVIIHVGAGAGSDGSSATPSMVRDIARSLPQLDLIACHFGGYHVLEQAQRLLADEPIYFDTSWPPTVAELGAARLAELIARHGADRVVFASDWPTASPQAELGQLRALGLPADQLALVLGGNAARLFGIDAHAA